MPTKWRGPMTPRQVALWWARRGTIEDKFWVRVEDVSAIDGCWLWQGAITTWGYGTLTVDGRARAAHRLSWEIHFGPIPEGMMVCHHCDVRDCVNPDHLFLGTARDNVRDMDAKGRRGHGYRVAVTHRGENHAAAKVSDADVAAIRAARESGMSARAVARQFGVSHTYIAKLMRGDLRAA